MTNIDITDRNINPLGLRPGDKLYLSSLFSRGPRTIENIGKSWDGSVVAKYAPEGSSYPLNEIPSQRYEIEFAPEIGDVYKLVGEAYDDYNVRNFEVTVTEVQNGTVLFTALQGHGGGSQPVLGHGPTRVIRLLPQIEPTPAPQEEVIKLEDLKYLDKVTLSNGNTYELDEDLEIELGTGRYLDQEDLDALGLTVTSVEIYVEPAPEPKPEDALPTVDGEYANPAGQPGYRRIYRLYNGAWSVLSQNFYWSSAEIHTGEKGRELAIKAFNDDIEEYRPVLLSNNN